MSFSFGSTRVLRELRSRVTVIARSPVPVLIEGEAGTGKESLATYLHTARGTGRMRKFLCDSTGVALSSPDGAANGDDGLLAGRAQDTVLFKRVHRLAPTAQEHMLLAIEGRQPGGPWILSTAAEPLPRLAAAGLFAPELAYRLSAYTITLPPLRERRPDIPELFAQMLNDLQAETGLRAPVPPAHTIERLADYDWPGNLRELENTVRTYLLFPDAERLEAEFSRKSEYALLHANGRTLKEQVRDASRRVEGEIIMRTLEQNRWNRRRAAQSLHISYRSLLYKMKHCNIRGERVGSEQVVP